MAPGDKRYQVGKFLQAHNPSIKLIVGSLRKAQRILYLQGQRIEGMTSFQPLIWSN